MSILATTYLAVKELHKKQDSICVIDTRQEYGHKNGFHNIIISKK